jgi:hypothetical protein
LYSKHFYNSGGVNAAFRPLREANFNSPPLPKRGHGRAFDLELLAAATAWHTRKSCSSVSMTVAANLGEYEKIIEIFMT